MNNQQQHLFYVQLITIQIVAQSLAVISNIIHWKCLTFHFWILPEEVEWTHVKITFSSFIKSIRLIKHLSFDTYCTSSPQPKFALSDQTTSSTSKRFTCVNRIIVNVWQLNLNSSMSHLLSTNIYVSSAACGKLQSILLSGCGKVTDAGLTALSAGCGKLRSINLRSCFQVTDAGISALVAGCGKLQSIDIWGCSNVTDACQSLYNM